MGSKKDSSWQNLSDYRSGKDKLKNAIIQHPEESAGSDSVYNYMKGEINRSGWVMPFDQYVNMGSKKANKVKKRK